ncbi:MAG: bifunctional 4-hydroxy-2-oxoglutarate aldolase/2-dehydro-3-deoxy-phosphogluconate aldolase [Candidatus Electrothrix aestuarii]|uniref:2-dehydro-3-deoxy-phosphogluconate aldolase n=1 Tax=Candidatus Electrothrix aestuarii TaxID=3062594 RepID=A0AAU8M135_9BACT|nr:bifunctional 4-hydroxy-2-oxoglutarate aldolase/2-dehydro-3-deoxy-phosphogluconate aldolase [Candidatus Electrothrix aestuarii]
MDKVISAPEVLLAGPVIPVIVINDSDHAVPLAQALVTGGIRVLEITLRSDAALEAIRRIRSNVPEALVGAGTVLSGQDLQAVAEAGGYFAISPGLTPSLLSAAEQMSIPLIPGVASASELMMALEAGLTELKFFPAQAAGGVEMLKSFAGPFPQVRFCPTGGITPENYREYLALKNVACVGGSWLVPAEKIAQGDWGALTQLAREAVAGAARIS